MLKLTMPKKKNTVEYVQKKNTRKREEVKRDDSKGPY